MYPHRQDRPRTWLAARVSVVFMSVTTMTNPSTPSTPTTYGGYRLVRRLGHGEHATVYLAYPDVDSAPAGPVAVKIFAPETAGDIVMTEIEALSRASGEHCVALLDLATGLDGGHALVLERLSGISLARLLAERARLRVGEAITVLAPLSGALARLHRAGVAHGKIRTDAIRFDGDGRPVLLGFGSARLFPSDLPAARLDGELAVAEDRDRFADVVRSVLLTVQDEGAAALLDWLSTANRDSRWCEELENRLFVLGAPSSIDLDARGEPAPEVPSRALTAAPHMSRNREASRPRSAPPGLAILGISDDLADVARTVIHRSLRSLRGVRRRLWITAGAVVVALVVALAVVVPDTSERPATHAAATDGQRDRSGGHTTGRHIATTDDPIEALSELLVTRERCYLDQSILCLDAVAQPGSSALDIDRQGIRSLSEGNIVVAEPIGTDRLVVIERLGATALVAVESPHDGEPASFLLMKGEAGWRIRDYLEE